MPISEKSALISKIKVLGDICGECHFGRRIISSAPRGLSHTLEVVDAVLRGIAQVKRTFEFFSPGSLEKVFNEKTTIYEQLEIHNHKIYIKHRKNCECCPGHYLSTSVY